MKQTIKHVFDPSTSAESNEILLETGDGPLHQSPSSPDWSGVDILRSNKEAVKPTYIRNICLYALKDLRHQVWVKYMLWIWIRSGAGSEVYPTLEMMIETSFHCHNMQRKLDHPSDTS